jgi:ABC-type nitrate/sulfonate/bicarbonate transport system permease component
MTDTVTIEPRSGTRRGLRVFLLRCALYGLLLALWWAASNASPPYIYPRPEDDY